MKLIMLPSLAALALVTTGFFSGAYAQSGQQSPALSGGKIETVTERPDEGQDDPIAEAVETQNACSCDCCQVQKLRPVDIQPKQDGVTITSFCSKSVSMPEGGREERLNVASESNDICPETCQIPYSNKVIISNKGEIDYNRYCNYNCQPVTDAQGTQCVQLSMKDYNLADVEDGNGRYLALPPVMGVGSGYDTPPPTQASDSGVVSKITFDSTGTGNTGVSEAPQPVAGTLNTNVPPANAVHIVYDMRKLISERLRSEAGAAVAQAASSAERVRINNFKTKQDLSKLVVLRTDVDTVAGEVEQSTSGVEKQKTTAEEAETKAKEALVESSVLAMQVVKSTKKLTDEAIKKFVTPCAEEAARQEAEAKGLDKPEDWNKVVAARAANPYQEGVTVAVQRTDEYKRMADGLMDKAFSTQQEANALIPHVNAMEAQGDTLGATIERKQVTNLLKRAKQIAADAAAAQTMAEKVRLTIPKWQNAAAQAAAYADWEYKNNANALDLKNPPTPEPPKSCC